MTQQTPTGTPVGVVPEPLTILGAGTALEFSTTFKRKLTQKKANKDNCCIDSITA
ncbi:PEP-CTERM sorting domain-containing protein [Rippkaea orientalis]|uniref:PEP-CTERM sorting domain-containing protein n=1 Tax=Rippkaea orientalis TaxID=2546366 RepID=UPI0002FA4E7F|nr:PEP-CTERM sorting domain-containing protein [Rippkaea orientalis]